MKNKPSTKNNTLLNFFLLTFILTLPAYILIGLASKNIILSSEIAFAFVPVAAFAPISAALILAFKKNGWHGVKKLFGRSFDYKRITKKVWYVPALFFPPFLLLLALGAAVLMGQWTLPAQFPLVAAPAVFLLFFGGALSEEVGWMGHAFEPMQARWNAFKAALLLGLIVALWHVPLYYFLIDDPLLLAAQLLFPVSLRILLAWLFNNSGKSLFATILFHTAYNAAYAVLPVNTVIATLFSFIAVIIITFLWGTETLANFRRKTVTRLSTSTKNI